MRQCADHLERFAEHAIRDVAPGDGIRAARFGCVRARLRNLFELARAVGGARALFGVVGLARARRALEPKLDVLLAQTVGGVWELSGRNCLHGVGSHVTAVSPA